MPRSAPASRSAAYQPALAWFVAVSSAWVFVLVMLGAFTTSIGAGMIFLDWPLSNGSLNPDGWLSDLMMFAEHSHRLSAGLMALLTVAIGVAVWRLEARAWVRRVAFAAFVLVWVQALVGGLRVLMDHLHVEMVNTSAGRLFAMLHAGLAQIYLCLLLAVALGLSRAWIERPRRPDTDTGPDRLGRWCCGLLVVQLVIAAVMRHSFAGLAIPVFPLSSTDGDLLPPTWNFRIGIHFAHRVMALVLTGVLIWWAVRLWKECGLKRAAAAIVALLGLQVWLGASVIWWHRHPYLTTGHVLGGACLLATVFGVTLWLHRERTGAHA